MDQIVKFIGIEKFLRQRMIVAVEERDAFSVEGELRQVVMAAEAESFGTGANGGMVVFVVAEDKVKGKTCEVLEHVRRDKVARMEICVRLVGRKERKSGECVGRMVVRVGEKGEKHADSVSVDWCIRILRTEIVGSDHCRFEDVSGQGVEGGMRLKGDGVLGIGSRIEPADGKPEIMLRADRPIASEEVPIEGDEGICVHVEAEFPRKGRNDGDGGKSEFEGIAGKQAARGIDGAV